MELAQFKLESQFNIKLLRQGCLIQSFQLYQHKIFLPIQMTVSTQYIDQLFANEHFKASLTAFNNSTQAIIVQNDQKPVEFQIQTVIEDITQVLYDNFRTLVQSQCNHLYESNRMILEQIQNLKNKLYSSNSSKLKTQSSTVEKDSKSKFDTSIFFEGDEQYDMRQIRRNIEDLHDDIENKILINSFQLEEQQKTYNDLEIDEKINASIQGSINRIQLSLQQKFQKYSHKLEQRIEQLKKTITSVVQAMNDPQYWNKEKSAKSNIHTQKSIPVAAFAKKQIKFDQNQRNKPNYESPEQKQAKCENSEIKNPEKQKQKQTQNSNKTIETLNKSINIGRSKIKSLFGFKSRSQQNKNEEPIKQ